MASAAAAAPPAALANDANLLLLAPTEDEYAGSKMLDTVGVQYYQGVIHDHEQVTFWREPTNQYDANAISVHSSYNPAANKLGHISRVNAALLAPMMDRYGLRVEGRVPWGAQNKYSIPLEVSFYCPRASVQAAKKMIAALQGRPVPIPVAASTASSLNSALLGPAAAYAAAAAAAPAYSVTARSGGYGDYAGAASAPSESALLSTHLEALYLEAIPYDEQEEAAQPAAVLTPLFTHQRKVRVRFTGVSGCHHY